MNDQPKPPFDKKDVAWCWTPTEEDKKSWGPALANEYVFARIPVLDDLHRYTVYGLYYDGWRTAGGTLPLILELLCQLAEARKEIATLCAAIATPEVYAGVVTEAVAQDREKLAALDEANNRIVTLEEAEKLLERLLSRDIHADDCPYAVVGGVPCTCVVGEIRKSLALQSAESKERCALCHGTGIMPGEHHVGDLYLPENPQTQKGPE